jgi:glutamine amidotransferase
VRVSSEPREVLAADRIVLPGVGAFGDCRRGLEAIGGLRQALERQVRERARPFLGICVGMQLMASRGYEHGDHPGLGWIPGEVVPILPPGTPGAPGGTFGPQTRTRLKLPHMGWNDFRLTRPEHPVLRGLSDGTYMYFVHSYHLRPADPRDELATVEYGAPLTAAVARDTLVGTQFHPEKSQAAGLRLLANFLAWRP